jgi:molybdopterin-binding protein
VSARGCRLTSQSHYPDQQELAIIDDHGGIDVKLSARNRIPATVTAVTAGEATANIELDAGGSRLVASITVEAAKELGLAPGTEVTAIIKASDVILAVAD